MKLLNLLVTIPPEQLPVTVQDFIDHARLNGITVGNQPDLIERELAAATRRAERYLRRSLITQTIAALFLPDGGMGCGNLIALPRGNAQSVVSVKTNDALADPATYRLQWNVVTADWAFSGPTEVVWISGYGDTGASVPDNICEGILEYAALLYSDREGLREPKYASVKAGVPNGIMDLWRPDQIEVSG